ncbi:hypothetical protein SAMN05216489_00520 [Streptomyces sp. 3213]|uniref:hypothetical protein n=1 Tax=Streptomyces sp. 3213.3 TaxID=1855348 RepID=UPI00089C3E47|nr:hypothetical protein [Streptomyces sp. 3213.3]SEC35521.1 hypothetical protein SAMN05216489_00520 [Streptomyces sp. 3213] [Streptomyces sp. 3213.3]
MTARLYVRSGLSPDAPDAAFAVLVVAPDGTPGERAMAELGAHCYEGDGALYLVRTDGWAEQSFDAGGLVVRVAVRTVALRQMDMDPEDFPERSAVDPEAAIVLTARTAVAPDLFTRPAEATAVFTADPDVPLDDLLTSEDEWPVVLAPPPQS